ncbi:MAG TPA: ATP-dependent Clp protease adaptor ClpS [Thermomicrobiales bacterium]|nr:ATP-dependent Clp protease adaptor ClpS [Thermomicrobiales bacterium]
MPSATSSPPAVAPAAPTTAPDVDLTYLAGRYPPQRVVLHNDDVHSMDEVVAALRKSVPGLGRRKAILIMLEAHLTGRSTVVVCAREQAEYYAERLGTFGLTVTIEPAE